jgi:hypothetical protein
MSALGRWTSVDPILGEFGPKTLLEQSRRLLSASPYDYTFGNPVNLIDPTGRSPEDWFQDKDGSFQYAETVKSQADLGEGQTYLGEQVLVKNGDNTEFLSADGSRGYVFDRESARAEEGSAGASGLSAAAAKQESTLGMAGKGGKALSRLKAVTKVVGQSATGASFLMSVGSEVAENDPFGAYEAVKLGADLGLAGGSAFGGPVGAGIGFTLEVSGVKEWAVRATTIKILEARADYVVSSE